MEDKIAIPTYIWTVKDNICIVIIIYFHPTQSQLKFSDLDQTRGDLDDIICGGLVNCGTILFSSTLVNRHIFDQTRTTIFFVHGLSRKITILINPMSTFWLRPGFKPGNLLVFPGVEFLLLFFYKRITIL